MVGLVYLKMNKMRADLQKDSWQNLLLQVRKSFQAGKEKEALDQLERFIRSEKQVMPAPVAMEYARLLEVNQQARQAMEILCQLASASHLSETAIAALFNLAGLQYRSGLPKAALLSYRRLLAAAPEHVGAWINYAKACKTTGDLRQAELCLRRALIIEPENVTAHWNLAHLLLSQGCFAEGWREYEWRFRRPEAFIPEGLDKIPAWRGEDLAGRRLLLWSEQGAGDAIQFVRFVKRLPGTPARVTLLAPENLRRLLGAVAGINEVKPFSFLAGAQAGYDFQASLLSLPFLLKLQHKDDLGAAPYLRGADFALSPNDGPAVANCNLDSPRLKVGLVWAGNPFHANDARRSLAPAELAPLGGVEKVVFFSLQKSFDGTSDALTNLPFQVVDLVPGLRDFADTSVCLQELDLLISVDTATAHLAGALGLPTWLLLPFEADWRWGVEGEKSYWYDSIRIFRQPEAGNWPAVLALVMSALDKSIAEDGFYGLA